MGYVGNQTSNSYSSMDKQVITGNGGASYTLTHAVANAQEIEVFVNNVRQEAGVAYTVAGTALSMTGNVASTDDFYVIYQGKALQTVVPPDGSVSTGKLANGAVTSAKLASGAAASNLGTSVNLATIKDSTGTNTAMTIDSSGNISTTGHISQGKVYYCAAKWNGSSTSTLSGNDVFTVYNTTSGNLVSGAHKIIYHNDYNMLNTSTGVVTIPEDGIWIFSGFYANQSGSAQRNIGVFWLNNTYYGEWVESYGQYDDSSTTRIMKLNANDTLRFGRNPGLPFDDFGFELARLG